MRKKVIVNILFYIVIIPILFYLAVNLFFKEKQMEILGFESYVVSSSSMEPDINKFDLIIVKQVDVEDLNERDAISFYAYLPTNQFDASNQRIYSKEVVTHYLAEIIIEQGQTIYKTQGATADPGEYDTWTLSDGVTPYDITYDDIIGEVTFVIPLIGYLFYLFYQPLLLFIILFNAFIIYMVIRVIKKSKKEVHTT